ncbi:MAG: extracellular solute-binding protein, partial [Caldilineaceae bacterium]|nr:extracellular solute-binding protein [Caldilineaceae bacterium]
MSERFAQQRLSRRTFLTFAGMTIAGSALAACAVAPAAPAAPAGGETAAPAEGALPFADRTLTIFSAQHHHADVKELWVPIFEEKTGAKVEWIEVGGGDVDAKYAVSVASQDGSFDTMYTWETLNAKYGRTLMEDITDSFDSGLLDGLVPAPRKALNFLGRQYGVPFDSNMAIFMWNKEIYEAAGLDPATPPETFEQFREFSKATTSDGKYATLFTMGDANSGFVTYISIFNSSGGQLLSDDLTKLQLDTDEGLAAMQALYDLFVTDKTADPAGVTVASSIEQGKIFRAGNMAHYYAFPNHYTLAQDPEQSQVVDKVQTGIIPGLSLRSGSVNGFEGYAINRFSPNKELALAWLEHTISPEVQSLVALNWGRPPALSATFDDPAVAEKAPQFASVKEQGGYPSPRYGSPFYFDVGAVFVEHMLAMMDGNMTPEEAVSTIQGEAQQIIDDYWAKAG